MRPIDQNELARKFAETWQLNVPERRSLRDQPLAGSLVAEAIAFIVNRDGWYPRDWRPDHDFDGGLIEYVATDLCQIHWKVEVGVNRSALIEVQAFQSVRAATQAYGQRFFGSNFDGIPIDWAR